MSICFETDTLVDELVTRCGIRPNLIAIVCNAVLKTMGALTERVISRELLTSVLYMSNDSGRDIVASFASMLNLTGDKRACYLDRMVLLPAFTYSTQDTTFIGRRFGGNWKDTG